MLRRAKPTNTALPKSHKPLGSRAIRRSAWSSHAWHVLDALQTQVGWVAGWLDGWVSEWVDDGWMGEQVDRMNEGVSESE